MFKKIKINKVKVIPTQKQTKQKKPKFKMDTIFNPPKTDFKNTFKIPEFAKVEMVSHNQPRPTISLTKPPKLPMRFQKAKGMSYPQAKQMFNISPFGDIDKDHVINMFDCRPFDYYKHKVNPEYADRPVSVFAYPGSTQADVFKRAEKKLPMIFDDNNSYVEQKYSDKLTNSLLERESTNPPEPFKTLVGTYTVPVRFSNEQTALVHAILNKYLDEKYQGEVDFNFDTDKSTDVNVIDYRITDGLLNQISFQQFRTGMRYDQIVNKIEQLRKEVGQKPEGMTGEQWREIASEKNEQLAELKALKQEIDAVAQQKAQKGVRTTKPIIKLLGADAPSEYTDLLKHLDTSVDTVSFVITDDPIDVMMKSTQPNEYGINMDGSTFMDYMGSEEDSSEALLWTSCERIGGPYGDGMWSDIKNHNGIAYIYLGNKKPGYDHPSGRIMIRWGENNNGEVDVGIEPSAYPWWRHEAEDGDRDKQDLYNDILRYALQEIIQSKGYFLGKVRTPYVYGGYSDNSGSYSHIKYHPYAKPDYEQDSELDLRSAMLKISKMENIPTVFQTHMARDLSKTVRGRVAKQKYTTTPILQTVARSPEEEIQLDVATRPDLYKEHKRVFYSLMDKPEDIRKGLLYDKDPLEIKEDVETRDKLLESPTMTEYMLQQPYAKSKHGLYALKQPYGKDIVSPVIWQVEKPSSPLSHKLISLGNKRDMIALMQKRGHSLGKAHRMRIAKKGPYTHPGLFQYTDLTPQEAKQIFEETDMPTKVSIFENAPDKLPFETIQWAKRSNDPETFALKNAIVSSSEPIGLDDIYIMAKMDFPGVSESRVAEFQQKLLHKLDSINMETPFTMRMSAEAIKNLLDKSTWSVIPAEAVPKIKSFVGTEYFNPLMESLVNKLEYHSGKGSGITFNNLKTKIKQSYVDLTPPTLSHETKQKMDALLFPPEEQKAEETKTDGELSKGDWVRIVAEHDGLKNTYNVTKDGSWGKILAMQRNGSQAIVEFYYLTGYESPVRELGEEHIVNSKLLKKLPGKPPEYKALSEQTFSTSVDGVELSVGDWVRVRDGSGANASYSYTHEGSYGKIVRFLRHEKVDVEWHYLTGGTPDNEDGNVFQIDIYYLEKLEGPPEHYNNVAEMRELVFSPGDRFKVYDYTGTILAVRQSEQGHEKVDVIVDGQDYIQPNIDVESVEMEKLDDKDYERTSSPDEVHDRLLDIKNNIDDNEDAITSGLIQGEFVCCETGEIYDNITDLISDMGNEDLIKVVADASTDDEEAMGMLMKGVMLSFLKRGLFDRVKRIIRIYGDYIVEPYLSIIKEFIDVIEAGE